MAHDLQTVRNVLTEEKHNILKRGNVVGVGVGYKMVEGKFTDELSIVCSVSNKKPGSKLDSADMVPGILRDVPTDVFETGEVIAFQDPKGKIRPAPGGVSIGHRAVTAGTLGLWVKKDGEFHILSNNHVMANSNDANIGDDILQPGPHDSGVESIAKLAQFVPIEFAGPENLVDAAIAKAVESEGGGSSCNIANAVSRALNLGAKSMGSKTRMKPVKIRGIEDIVKDEILKIGKVTELAEGELGMEVKKMGRTTGLTFGKIQQVDATIKVNYGVHSAFFADQLIAGDMSRGGDSGSAVVTKDGNKLVGLLFAGSDVVTVMNRIQNVFSALDITL